MEETPILNLPIDRVLATLDTTPEGLVSQEANRRYAVDGPNDPADQKEPPAWLLFLSRFRNPLVLILLFASALSAATGDVTSFIIVIAVVLLSVSMDFLQERRAKNTLAALRAKVALRARVIRDGKEITLPVRQLVRGDIVKLVAGDLVPADGRLLAAQYLYVNQALLTGEPYPSEKRATDDPRPEFELGTAANAVFAGTSVISGSGTLVVCRTGRATALGKIAQGVAAPARPSAFEAGVLRFGQLLLRITGLLVLFVLIESMMFRRPWLESLLFAVSLAVGLTPELLPMILTVTLARGAVRLAQKRVIIKRLASIHNLGAVDVLCTDKTGTLTEARIQLVGHIDFDGNESERVFKLAYLNSYFETGFKSPLDDAILAHDTPDVTNWRKLDEVPFDFERRRVSVFLEECGRRFLVVKGAPEDILRLSTSFEAGDGSAQPMTATARAALQARFEQISADGFRALGIATRVVDSDCKNTVDSENQLTFAGFATFLDPPKASAAAAVRALANSGVAVKILTGDNDRVTRRLCGELGIPVLGIATGEELSTMSEEALLGSLPRLNVFCRVTPQQKMRVLDAVKRSGQVVGFLGDGINDAAALHAADVGISVDAGADVAKAAADIILLEQDLGVLHDGVVEGRRTVVNVDKYILMASSANFGNILSMALAGLILPFLPLLPTQVLLTNLVYDFAQTGLPFDRVDSEVITRPVHWDIGLIERFMILMGPISTIFDLVTFGVLMFVLRVDQMQFRTGWFIESLVTQILMIFAVRTQRHLFASRPHPLVTVLALGTSALTVALPYLPVGRWFGFVAPAAPYFVFLVIAVAGFLVLIEAAKRAFYAALMRSGTRFAR